MRTQTMQLLAEYCGQKRDKEGNPYFVYTSGETSSIHNRKSGGHNLRILIMSSCWDIDIWTGEKYTIEKPAHKYYKMGAYSSIEAAKQDADVAIGLFERFLKTGEWKQPNNTPDFQRALKDAAEGKPIPFGAIYND